MRVPGCLEPEALPWAFIFQMLFRLLGSNCKTGGLGRGLQIQQTQSFIAGYVCVFILLYFISFHYMCVCVFILHENAKNLKYTNNVGMNYNLGEMRRESIHSFIRNCNFKK